MAKKISKRRAKQAPRRTPPTSSKPVAAQAPELPAEPPAEQPAEHAPDEIIVVAVRGMILFPGVVLPILIGRERSVAAIQAAVQNERPLGLLLQRDGDNEDPSPDELYTVGTQAAILRYLTAPDGAHHAIVQGQQRFEIVEYTQTQPFLKARVRLLGERIDGNRKARARKLTTEQKALFRSLKQLASEALELLPERNEELENAVSSTTAPSQLCDLLATFMELAPAIKQEILETVPIGARLERVFGELKQAVKVMRLSRDINLQTRGALDKAQREYYLREQLRQIQKELGEGGSNELEELRQQIDAAGMPEQPLAEAHKELTRLERTPEASMEHGTIRTYLDWLCELPWSKQSDDRIQIKAARQILDEDHFGLEKVKKRILEFLAVRKLKPDGKSPILCLVGPPGVGKTSLGHSIARAMGREFVRVSLGGVHDESEIRGHRRTYVGSMPGRIVRGIRSAGTNNPVFLLDEMDKLGSGFHGDPSSALLEVLDPEQNRTFTDHYLDVPFDLSRVMFIATANVLHEIPGPLRDRCEVLEIAGYTAEEKLEIATRFLIGRQLEANGLTQAQCRISKAALRSIITDYTREAGCRNLEREIGAVVRHVATRVAQNSRVRAKIGPAELPAILGPLRFESEVALRTSAPGVATGLSWTPVGGQILFIEASRMPGAGKLILTGQLGDVMRESAQAAFSLVRSQSSELGIDPAVFETEDVHIHVPAGAIPKDGPSAGVTIYTALVSLFTDRKISARVAMTGEISLRGLVMPVGGIKEKVLAAHAAGIKTVLLPRRNERDLVDVPEGARRGLRFVFIEHVEEALESAFAASRPARKAAAERARSSGASAPKKRGQPASGPRAESRPRPQRKGGNIAAR